MPVPFSTYINGMDYTFATAMSYLHSGALYLDTAGTWLAAQGHTTAGNALSQAMYSFHACHTWLMSQTNDNYYYYEKLAMSWLNLNVTPPVPFDMSALLGAMLTATFDQLTMFVGIEDAYRSAIWDSPFNAEFYAALARGFRQ